MAATKKKKKKTATKKKKPAKQAAASSCDVCGMEVSDIHCRLMCPKCGATRDCSDP